MYEDNYFGPCSCHLNCKCKSIKDSVHDELYDSFNIPQNEETVQPNNDKKHFNKDEDEDKSDERNYMHCRVRNNEEDDDKIKSLRCTFDMSGFQTMSQPMYHCRICKVYICQSCAFLCHKGHPLNFRGVESNASCQCFNKANCCCTFRKDVVCSYAFFGKELIYQPWYKCITCRTRQNEGYCAICAKKCNHDHDIYCKGFIEHYCECGANAFKRECKALKFPPFNYLSSCTNREQMYQLTKQRLYHCKTCGITAQNQGICEACALFSHPGTKWCFLEQVNLCASA